MNVLPVDSTAVFTTPEVFVPGDGPRLNYRLYKPALQPGAKVPLVLFLHGSGECGSDNRSQLVHCVPALVSYLRAKDAKAIVVAPQCQSMQDGWVDIDCIRRRAAMPAEPTRTMKGVIGLLDSMVASGMVDASRVYVTGLSLGGFGTWDLIQRRAQSFAAAMPLCGGGDVSLAPKLAGLPIWVFHGEKDPAVPVECSREMVRAIDAAGGRKILYSETPGAGHDIWTAAYSDEAVWDWLFEQRK